MITTVNSSAALNAALKTAHAGDTILLAPGNYDAESINGINPAGMVTITSADPSHQAVIAGLSVQNSSNLTFSHLEMTPDARLAFGVILQYDNNIHLDSINVHSTATQAGDGVELRNSTNVSLTNSSIHDVGRGVLELSDTGVTATGNTLQNVSSNYKVYADAVSTGVVNSGNTIVAAPAAAPTPPAATQPAATTTTTTTTTSSQASAPTPPAAPPATPPATPTPPATTTTTASSTSSAATAPSTASHTVTVNSDTALNAALKTAHAGDTILLAPGSYDAESINGINPTGMVTITSADPSHEAVIAGLTVQNSSNLTFSHLEVTPDARLGFGVTLGYDNNIHLDSLNVHSTASQAGDGVELRNSTNVSLTNSSIHDVGRGVLELSDTGVTATGNTLQNVSSNYKVYADAVSTGVVNSGNTIIAAPASTTTPPATTPPTTTGTSITAPPVVGTGPHTVTVTSADGLYAALKTAHAGDVIQLAAGNYGEINLNGLNMDGKVTVTSADPTHEASIVGLNVQNSSNLTFSHLDLTPDTRSGYAATLMTDNNVNLDSMNIHGLSATAPAGDGLMMRNSTNVSITNSNFQDLGTGISHVDDDGVLIAGNTIHNIESDGIHGGGSSDITITGNVLSDFHPLGADHPDAIQFWTSGTTASVHNITVTDNIIDRGSGVAVQGIFMNNENSLTYQNVTITGNALVGTMYNGILVYDASNADIENNLVEGYQDMMSKIWLNNVAGGTVANNTTTELDVLSGVTGVNVHSNTIIAQGAAGDLTQLNHFVGSTIHDSQIF